MWSVTSTWNRLYLAMFGYNSLSLAVIGCHRLSSAVIRCHPLSSAVIGCHLLSLAVICYHRLFWTDYAVNLSLIAMLYLALIILPHKTPMGSNCIYGLDSLFAKHTHNHFLFKKGAHVMGQLLGHNWPLTLGFTLWVIGGFFPRRGEYIPSPPSC